MVLQISADADQTRPGDEQRSNCLAVVALDPDLTIPTDPDQFGESTSVVRVAFVHSHRQHGVGVARVHAHDWKADALEFVPLLVRAESEAGVAARPLTKI